MPLHSKTPSIHAPALYLLPGMMLGLVLAERIEAPLPVLVAAAAGLAAVAVRMSRSEANKHLWLGCFVISSALAFWAYAQVRLPAKPDAFSLSLPEREATLVLRIERVMQPLSRYGKSTGIARVLDAPKTSRLLPDASVYYSLTPSKNEPLEILPGLRLKATGVLQPIPPPAEGEDFDAYLKDSGIHYRFERTSKLEVVAAPSGFKRFCHAVNQHFQHDLRLGATDDSDLPKIYVAMLLGLKTELTSGQSERFRMTGTMHFFAISGLHIGVIASVIAQTLILLRVPRRFSPLIGLPLLYLYVEITGASPSAVRAFLMAAFFWASYVIGRQRSPLGALAASAVAVLLIAPEQLHSVGFQLSYSVVLSILLFGLPLYEALLERYRPYKLLPEESWTRGHHIRAWSLDKLYLLFAISSSAWLASTPLSAGLFGLIAPAAILLNMLLVYLAALVISGGVISLGLATIGLPGACGFLNHSAWVSISVMDTIVGLSTDLPSCVLRCEQFPAAISYLTLIVYFGMLLWLHQDRTRFSTKSILLPPGFVLTMITLGYLIAQQT